MGQEINHSPHEMEMMIWYLEILRQHARKNNKIGAVSKAEHSKFSASTP